MAVPRPHHMGWVRAGGAKMTAPRARGGLERAGLIGFMGRDPDPVES